MGTTFKNQNQNTLKPSHVIDDKPRNQMRIILLKLSHPMEIYLYLEDVQDDLFYVQGKTICTSFVLYFMFCIKQAGSVLSWRLLFLKDVIRHFEKTFEK